ncbi:LuxR family transcriptional regulator [Streptomyces sp. CB03234]|uniref:TrmB family transcriptional regulator sugar-binding domain-containing protein n=1 Tax=Streptomyces sp. (strain CB03234) TaxID=1703937 RepID=UPI00093B48A4|nr:TrmB family transcriptional regulator sugar-binding domain-containing protein [Streptomyces sp. CB03234]OKK04824.1 LuxR family transcriptional regulator [Streptomyces sp. CB03234]
MSTGAESDLEHALLQVRDLIESTVAIQRSHTSQQRLISQIGGDYAAILGHAQRLIESATRSIDIVHARHLSPGERSEVIFSELGERPERDLIYHAAEGVSVRLLTRPSMLDDDYVREQVGRERPTAIRVAKVPPLQALVVDGREALVVAESAGGRQASLIRVPELLHTLMTLFESVWTNAVPAGERIVFGDRDRALLARQILAALRAGVTDEVAARQLTVSVRTYRRYIAEIMTLLRANSRFQAGVRAAELGLLPPPPPGSDGCGPGAAAVASS